ncbi:MAG: potassium channel family protein [Janthinobacterium lividum]
MFAALAIVLALILLAVAAQDAFEVMLLPRRVYRRVRLARLYFRAAWSGWVWLANRLSADERRIRFLGVFGPLSLVILFAFWAALFIVGFGLLQWALQDHSRNLSPLTEQFYMSGVTFFTVGYGDVAPHTALTRVLAVVEAGLGLGFIAVVIGYLPVLYQLFARREAHVIQLDARAGSPPTATTMIVLHAEPGGLAKLDELLREWEIWGAELLESHLSYPMLVYYRSQHDNQSWLAAMTAVMDVSALILVGIEDMQPLQARMTFTMTRQVIVEMSRALGIGPSPFEGNDRLSHESYLAMETDFRNAGVNWTGGANVEDVLHALRSTYEPLLDGLSRRLSLQLPPWSPPDGAAGHWHGGHRGLIAKRLVEQLAGPGHQGVTSEPSAGRFGTRLRRRLRRK